MIVATATHTVPLNVVAGPISAIQQDRMVSAVCETIMLRDGVDATAPGSLPNDGKVIEDARSYD